MSTGPVGFRLLWEGEEGSGDLESRRAGSGPLISPRGVAVHRDSHFSLERVMFDTLPSIVDFRVILSTTQTLTLYVGFFFSGLELRDPPASAS